MGSLKLHVPLTINMSELRDWKPERIARLFEGIAGVIAAVNDVPGDKLHLATTERRGRERGCVQGCA
jgi:hypothetical protein